MNKNVFIGRNKELQTLEILLTEVDSGTGKIVLIQGDPGSGKSTLIRKFLSQISANTNYLIAESECVDKEGINAYLPFKEILIEINANTVSENPEETRKQKKEKLKSFITEAGTHWIGLIPVVGSFAQAGLETYNTYKDQFGKKEPEAIKSEFDIQQSFEKEFRRLAQNKTIVIFLDDLQWADNASLNLLFSLSRSIRKNPFKIMLIASYRPNDIKIGRNKISENGENIVVRHPLSDTLNELHNYTKEDLNNSNKNKWLHEITVTSFSENEINLLINKKFEKNKFDSDFYTKLQNITQGHPLFVNEILQNLEQKGIIYLDNQNYYIVKSLELNQLPTSINGIIAERLERLDKELRKIISYASIDGEDVTIQILEKLLKIDELDLLDHIEELSKQHGLLQEAEPIRINNKLLDLYHFTHTLVHKYVYENLDASRRRALHRRLSEVLKEIYGDDLSKYKEIKQRYDLHNQIGQGLIDGITFKITSNQLTEEKNNTENSDFNNSLQEAVKSEIEAAKANFEQFAMLECIDHCDKSLAFILQLGVNTETNLLKFEALKIKTDALHWKGNYQKAFENSEKILKTALELNISEKIALALSLNAKCLEAIGKYEQAIENYSKALEINKLSNQVEYANNLNSLGYVKVRFGKYSEAIQNFETALKIFENQNNEEKSAESIMNLGYANRMYGDYDKAIKYYGKALLIFERLDIKRKISDCYNSIGLSFNWKGEYEKGITFFEKSLEIDNEINDIVNKANHLNNIGLAKENLGLFDEAINFYLKTLEIDESLGDKVKIAISYSNIGSCYTREGNSFSKSQNFLEKALNIYEELNDKINIASTYQNIGENYRLQSDIENAFDYFNRSLKIDEQIGDIKAIVGDYINIANVYSLKQDYLKSIEYYNKTLKHFQEINDKINLAIIYNNLSESYRMLDDYEQAKSFIFKSIEISKSVNDKMALKRNYQILGSIYLDLKLYDQALETYYTTLKISEELNLSNDTAEYNSKIGFIFEQKSDFKKAISYYEKAANEFQNSGNFEALINNFNNIASIYTDDNKIDLALNYYNKSLKIAQNYNLLNQIADNYNNIGYTYYKNNDVKKAIEFYLKAVEKYKELDDIEGLRRNYSNLTFCYEDIENLQKAIEYQKLVTDCLLIIGDNGLLADAYQSLGILNYKIENDDQALDSYYDAYDLYKSLNDYIGMANTVYNIAIIQKYKNLFKEALHNLNIAKNIYSENDIDAEEVENQIKEVMKLMNNKDIDTNPWSTK